MLPQAWRPALREPVSSSARITGRLNKSREGSLVPYKARGPTPVPEQSDTGVGSQQHGGTRGPRPPEPRATRRQGRHGAEATGRNFMGLPPSLNFYEHAPFIKILLASPHYLSRPGDQETRLPNGQEARAAKARRPGCRMARRPGCRMARRPGWRMTGGPETRLPNGRRPGDQGAFKQNNDNVKRVIQIKTMIISNLAEKTS